MKFEESLSKINDVMTSLKGSGIAVKPLEDVIENLKTYVSHINQVEEASEAIRDEIITPIKTELEAGSILSKRSNLIGIGGALLGLLSIVVSIFLSYTSSQDLARLESRFAGVNANEDSASTDLETTSAFTKIDQRLARIEAVISPNSYFSLQKDSIVVTPDEVAEVQTQGDGKIGIGFTGLVEVLPGSEICTKIKLYADSAQLGDAAFLGEQDIKLYDRSFRTQIVGKALAERVNIDRLLVCKGETIEFFENSYVIIDIESTDAAGRARADSVSRMTLAARGLPINKSKHGNSVKKSSEP